VKSGLSAQHKRISPDTRSTSPDPATGNPALFNITQKFGGSDLTGKHNELMFSAERNALLIPGCLCERNLTAETKPMRNALDC
jgi:hypothetical protein